MMAGCKLMATCCCYLMAGNLLMPSCCVLLHGTVCMRGTELLQVLEGDHGRLGQQAAGWDEQS